MATKMTRAERERFFTTLAHATDERAVQAAYETGLLIFLPKGTTFDYPCKCDGYLDVDMFLRLLLEYKLNERLEVRRSEGDENGEWGGKGRNRKEL